MPEAFEPFEPFEIIKGDYSKGLLLLCDHACNTIPQQYNRLGISPDELELHIAYDIGAEGIFRGLAHILGVPGIMSTYSRLLIDPNRGIDDPTLVRQLYDGIIIPGNYPITESERQKRITRFYQPYHQAIDQMLGEFELAGSVPAVISVHTMTDVWNGGKRPWEISVLWDKDPRLAKDLLGALGLHRGLTVGDNKPYDGALGGDTMFQHCTLKGLSHALLEFRQDLVADDEGIRVWVNLIAPIIEKLNRLPHNHEKQWFGSRAEM